MKDHEIAEVINQLRDIAIEFHGAQQLRERIAHVIVPLLKISQHDEPTHDNHPGHHDGMTCKQASQWLTDYNECLLRGQSMTPIPKKEPK